MLLIYNNSISSKHQHWTNSLTDISNFHCVKTKAKCQFWNKTLICLLKLTGQVRRDTLVYEQPPYRYCCTKLTAYPSNKSPQQVTKGHIFAGSLFRCWFCEHIFLISYPMMLEVLLLLACLTPITHSHLLCESEIIKTENLVLSQTWFMASTVTSGRSVRCCCHV